MLSELASVTDISGIEGVLDHPVDHVFPEPFTADIDLFTVLARS